jgi:hypothetical protein
LSAKDYIEVVIQESQDGQEYLFNGEPVALKLKGRTVADLRQHPPFLAFSLCPYCQATNNRNHDNLKHIDPFLGTINSESVK